MKIMLKNVRLAFPALFEPRAVNSEGDAAFSATFIISPDDPQVKEIERAIEAVAKEKWGDRAAGILKQLKQNNKTPLRDGSAKENYEGFAGNLYISARSKTRPTVIDRDKTELTSMDGRPYAGCYVNALVDFWAQDNSYGKRINASLKGVQFVRDGDAFAGSGAVTKDEFEDLSVSDSAAADLV